MSAKLLNKHKKDIEPVKYQWRYLIALPVWVALSFLAANAVLIIFFWLFNIVGLSIRDLFNPIVFQTVIAGLTYVLTLSIAIGVPYLVRKRKPTLETLGLSRLMTWTDIGLAPVAFIVYALVLAGAMQAIMQLIPSFPVDQVQDIGFKSISRQSEYALAFLILVVIGPFAEELLFRGYLYGKLRTHVPVYAAIIATSVLFALAHGQWNVAIDTFLLSIVMCGLREITGSIWAGILVHMLKNAVAFYGIFVVPLLMLGS
jgi:membrane protease YdiL (CAAX protease family)